MNLTQFTKDGKYLMLAFDHRGSFKKLMNPDDPDSVTDEQIISLKKEIIDSIKDQFSGLLIDVEYGLKAYESKDKPFLLPVEKSGFKDLNGERVSELQYSAQEIKDLGASGAKILIYFNPYLNTANQQLITSKKVLDECSKLDFPYFLEIVVYGHETEDISKLRPKLVLDSLRMFVNSGVVPSVFKLEYPGNIESCQEISKIVGSTPWILLTRGDTFETFKTELKEAVSCGAVGFLAGRALWQEVCSLQGQEKKKFLVETLPTRFKEISNIMMSS